MIEWINDDDAFTPVLVSEKGIIEMTPMERKIAFGGKYHMRKGGWKEFLTRHGVDPSRFNTTRSPASLALVR